MKNQIAKFNCYTCSFTTIKTRTIVINFLRYDRGEDAVKTFLRILEEFWFPSSFLFKNSGAKVSSFSIAGPVVRLVGGPASSIGRVEVFHFGEWGTVCEDRWTINDGHVACRMLNFSRAVQLFDGSTFGGGLGMKIWLTKLVCNGTENSLFECKNAMKFLGITGCTHDQDAGVQCAEDGKLLNVDTRAWPSTVPFVRMYFGWSVLFSPGLWKAKLLMFTLIPGANSVRYPLS